MNTNDNNDVQQTDVQANDDSKLETDPQTAPDDKAKSDDTHKDIDKQSEKTLKALDKMRSRISAEAGKKNEYKNKLADTQKQVEDLTKQLDALRNPDARNKQEKDDGNAELDKANKQIADLQAQLQQGQQIQEAYDQLNKVDIPASKDIVALAVPKGASHDEVTKNLHAIINLYFDAKSAARKSFMTGSTPRATGSSKKPITKKDLSNITDTQTRLDFIKEHLDDFE